MKKGLDLWKLKRYLTIHEAACLALNVDPNKLSKEPNGWGAVYAALLEDIYSIDAKNSFSVRFHYHDPTWDMSEREIPGEIDLLYRN